MLKSLLLFFQKSFKTNVQLKLEVTFHDKCRYNSTLLKSFILKKKSILYNPFYLNLFIL
jgi:hypothetical protein